MKGTSLTNWGLGFAGLFLTEAAAVTTEAIFFTPSPSLPLLTKFTPHSAAVPSHHPSIPGAGKQLQAIPELLPPFPHIVSSSVLASLISSFFPTKPIHTHPPPTWHRTAPEGGITWNIGWGYLHYQYLSFRLAITPFIIGLTLSQDYCLFLRHDKGKIGKLDTCMFKFLYHEV